MAFLFNLEEHTQFLLFEPILEGLHSERIWDTSFKKVQNNSRKDQKVKRIQALANSDSSASASINANPARYLFIMSDTTFKTAWRIRNLKDVVNLELWCRCGKQKMDSLSQRLYVCSAKKIYGSVRGHLHFALKTNVTSGALQYIYQRISVSFQNSLAEIIFKATHHFSSKAPQTPSNWTWSWVWSTI